MSDEDQKPKQELTLEIAFNNLVGVAREMKLNHNEHMLLERSVQKVLEGLNDLQEAERTAEEIANRATNAPESLSQVKEGV